jgi:hypothetical protein
MGRCVLSLFLALFGLAITAGEPVPARLPLEAGFAWIYRGQVKWTDAENHVMEQELQWKVRVLEVVKRKGQVIARLEGWPEDLAWYEPGKGPGIYVAIQDSAGLTLVSDEAARDLWKRLQNAPAKGLGSDDRAKGELILPARLREGQAWGDEESLARPDGQYARRVEEVGILGLDGLGGWTGSARGTFYRIAYRTNPDHTLMDFVPGLGFTRYTYVHHGTVSECDLRLVAVERRSARPNPMPRPRK